MSVGAAAATANAAGAVSLYVSTCRLAMLASAVVDEDDQEAVVDAPPNISVNHNNDNNNNSNSMTGDESGGRCPSSTVHWTELYRLLPCLRQALTCTHCSRIVADPVEMSGDAASACRSCAVRNDPNASTSTDLQLRIVVQCYQKLCEFLENSRGLYRKLGAVSTNGGTRTLGDLIIEGAALGSSRARSSSLAAAVANTRPTDGHFLLSRLLSAPPMSSALRSNEILVCNGLQQQQQQPEPQEDQQQPTDTAAAPPESYSVSMDVDRSTRITIKRKHKSSSSSSVSSSSSSSSNDSLPLAAYAASKSSAYMNKRISSSASVVQDEQPPAIAKSFIFKGCRCGNATLHPGKLTCCGQRCSCYVNKLECENCECRGCKNPRNTLGDDDDEAKKQATSTSSVTSSSSLSTTSASSSSSVSSDSSRSLPSCPPKTTASRKSGAAVSKRRTKT